VARLNQLDASFDQGMGYFEIRRAKKSETTLRAVTGEIPGDDCRNGWIAAHANSCFH
jgi:hypothetical protein